MKQISILIFTLIAFSIQSWGQDTTSKDWRVFPTKNDTKWVKPMVEIKAPSQGPNYNTPDGKVQVYQDPRIDQIGEQLRNKPYIYGYTVQLEVSQQKNVIKDARYRILKIKPDVELDDPYESPNIYLYAGRFYDRISAYKFKNDIGAYFPNAIVVGPKKMDLPYIKNSVTVQDSTVIGN